MKEVNLIYTPDDLGPEKVICAFDPAAGMQGILVVDNTALGVGKGGVRLVPDLDAGDALRLARKMTLRNAMADLPFGGAAGAIRHDTAAGDRDRMMRAFFRSLGSLIPNEYVCGLDTDAGEEDVAVIAEELCGRRSDSGRPAFVGGTRYDQLGLTGYGVIKAVMAACEFKGIAARGARLAVQGFGALGRSVVKFACEEQMNVVAVADVKGGVYHPEGLEAQALYKEYAERGTVAYFSRGKGFAPGEELTVACDILVLCARAETQERAARQIKAPIIAEGASGAVLPEVRNYLEARGAIYLPDMIIRVGGMIGAYVEYINGTPMTAIEKVSGTVTRNVQTVLCESHIKGITTREAGIALARERVVRAMKAKGTWQE